MRKCFRGVLGLSIAAALAAGLSANAAQAAEETIKIGVLHSLSGTMAISETTLKDTVLMMVDDLNQHSGLLGKKVEVVVVDPASNWPLFAEKAREATQLPRRSRGQRGQPEERWPHSDVRGAGSD